MYQLKRLAMMIIFRFLLLFLVSALVVAEPLQVLCDAPTTRVDGSPLTSIDYFIFEFESGTESDLVQTDECNTIYDFGPVSYVISAYAVVDQRASDPLSITIGAPPSPPSSVSIIYNYEVR